MTKRMTVQVFFQHFFENFPTKRVFDEPVGRCGLQYMRDEKNTMMDRTKHRVQPRQYTLAFILTVSHNFLPTCIFSSVNTGGLNLRFKIRGII